MGALKSQVPEDSFWENKVGLGLNAAFQDPPVFFLLGKVQETSDVTSALAGIDSKYPGTAKVGWKRRRGVLRGIRECHTAERVGWANVRIIC